MKRFLLICVFCVFLGSVEAFSQDTMYVSLKNGETIKYPLEEINELYFEQKDGIIKKYDTITDTRDGQKYRTIKIGEQTWFAENLRYYPEDLYFKDHRISTPINFGQYSVNEKPAYSIYNYNGGKYWESKNFKANGVLYNIYVLKQVDVCPAGWHIPSSGEWDLLIEKAGGDQLAGYRLKPENYDGNDKFGFNASMGGIISINGIWYRIL